jgi:hypothetical protein
MKARKTRGLKAPDSEEEGLICMDFILVRTPAGRKRFEEPSIGAGVDSWFGEIGSVGC